jgi:hypothetical protein
MSDMFIAESLIKNGVLEKEWASWKPY